MSSTIVPWTNVGGTPCCCEGACYSDLETEPIPVFAEGFWQPIAGEDYASLLAGGTYAVAVSVDVASRSTGWFPGPPVRSEIQTGSGTVALAYESPNDGCYAKLSTTSANITINARLESFTNSYLLNDITLYRSLATVAGVRYINFSNIDLDNNTWSSTLFLNDRFSALVFGDLYAVIFGNVSESDWIASAPGTNRKFVSASTELTFSINGNDYTQIGVIGGQFLTPTNMALVNLNGLVNLAVTFTPFPP